MAGAKRRKQPRRVFISYTGKDLDAHADVAADVVRRMEWVAVDHRDWPATGQPSVAECLERVKGCDVLVVLVAHRYGWIPKKGEGGQGGKSIVWMEVDEARAHGLPVLPFVIDEDAGWSPKQIEALSTPAVAKPLSRFKTEICKTVRATFGTQPESLAEPVRHALESVAGSLRSGRRRTRPDADVDPVEVYRRRVVELHSRLVPFAPYEAGKHLGDVAVEVDVTPDAPDGDAALVEAAAELRLDLHGDLTKHEVRRLTRVTEAKLGAARTLRSLLAALPATADGPFPRWRVLGDPGAGKTTVARNLARQLADEPKGPLPVFASVTRLAESKGDLVAVAMSDLAGDAALRARFAAHLRGLMKRKGAVWVLLDGFDEVPEPLRDEAWRAVESVAETWSRSPVAVLSRPVAFERTEAWAGFGTAKVRALDDARQAELATRLVGAEIAGSVLGAARSNERLAELARSPLMLTLLVFVGRDALAEHREVPSSATKLLGRAVELLLERGYGLTPRPVRDVTAARELLGALSLALHRAGGEVWWRRDLAGTLWAIRRRKVEDAPDAGDLSQLVVDVWKGSNDVFLDDVGDNSGVLGPHDGRRERWRYLHRALREFLAAERLAALPDGRGEALVREWLRNATKERGPEVAEWAEVFHLYLALTNAPAERIAELVQVSKGLGLRALRSQEHIAADDRLRIALDADVSDGRDLILAVRAHPDADRAAGILWAAVRPGRKSDALGRILWGLDRIGRPAERERFFRACEWWLPDRIPELTFVRVPPGTFRMGSPPHEPGREDDEGPVQDVHVGAFELAAVPVTVGQLSAFGFRPEEDEDLPAVRVSWWTARAFCAWIGARLPSEAEWEYACRAGSPHAYSSGDTREDLDRVGWYELNSGGRRHPVGTKPANAFGLSDMHGNVFEWVEDDWHASHAGRPLDGTPWTDDASEERIVRGGSFASPARFARSAHRYALGVAERGRAIGFRPARSVPG